MTKKCTCEVKLEKLKTINSVKYDFALYTNRPKIVTNMRESIQQWLVFWGFSTNSEINYIWTTKNLNGTILKFKTTLDNYEGGCGFCGGDILTLKDIKKVIILQKYSKFSFNSIREYLTAALKENDITLY